MFKQYSDVETDNVEFQDINEFCIKQLELKHASIVGAIVENRTEKTNSSVLKAQPESVVQDDKGLVEKDYTKPEEAFSEEELVLFRRIEYLRSQI